MDGLRNKINDVQAIVTMLAVLLMMPPVILIFNGAGLIGDIPVVLIFIFGTWLALIWVTWFLGRLSDDAAGKGSAPTPSVDPTK